MYGIPIWPPIDWHPIDKYPIKPWKPQPLYGTVISDLELM